MLLYRYRYAHELLDIKFFINFSSAEVFRVITTTYLSTEFQTTYFST